MEYASSAIAHATGWSDFDQKEALEAGERMINIQRIIAIKRGFKPEDEFDISDRLLEAPTVGVAAGKSMKPHLKQMVEEYYGHMGWENARPTEATLKRLGLEGEL